MAGSLLKNKLDAYKCSANDAIHFKLVRNENDITDEKTTFFPDMTHQIFGEQESIFGYKDLIIELYYSAARLTTYINMTHSDEITPDKLVDTSGISLPKADNVMATITKELPAGYLSNLDHFVSCLEKEVNFKPFGELLHTYTIHKDNSDRHFEIYKTNIECPGFRQYHERLQAFILFFIDAASFIDVDDDRWHFYLVFEKYRCDGNNMYAIAGYMTVYNYYAYPEKIRPRISQVLILPPFQKQGHGAELIQMFYQDCYHRSDILDITVEDPSENFQRLRDFVDARNCSKLKHFQPDYLMEGFSEDMAHEAQYKLKLSKRQARRVYEIIRLKITDQSNKEQFKRYRLDVKKRLNAPFKRNGRDFQKLEKALDPVELNQTLGCMSTEQRITFLELAFEDLMEQYQHVIDRVSAS